MRGRRFPGKRPRPREMLRGHRFAVSCVSIRSLTQNRRRRKNAAPKNARLAQ